MVPVAHNMTNTTTAMTTTAKTGHCHGGVCFPLTLGITSSSGSHGVDGRSGSCLAGTAGGSMISYLSSRSSEPRNAPTRRLGPSARGHGRIPRGRTPGALRTRRADTRDAVIRHARDSPVRLPSDMRGGVFACPEKVPAESGQPEQYGVGDPALQATQTETTRFQVCAPAMAGKSPMASQRHMSLGR